jgi:hypothetical protein
MQTNLENFRRNFRFLRNLPIASYPFFSSGLEPGCANWFPAEAFSLIYIHELPSCLSPGINDNPQPSFV